MKRFEVKFRKTAVCVASIEAKTEAEAREKFNGAGWEDDSEIDLVDWQVLSVKEDKS